MGNNLNLLATQLENFVSANYPDVVAYVNSNDSPYILDVYEAFLLTYEGAVAQYASTFMNQINTDFPNRTIQSLSTDVTR